MWSRLGFDVRLFGESFCWQDFSQARLREVAQILLEPSNILFFSNHL